MFIVLKDYIPYTGKQAQNMPLAISNMEMEEFGV